MTVSPLNLGQQWQLFLDDYAIARSTGLTRVLHHPRARGVVIPADKPWETAGVETLYGSGIGRRDDGSFFAFYRAMWWDSGVASQLPGTGKLDRAHYARQ